MPNWCSNHITVRGDNPAEIQRLAAAFADSGLCNAVIPVPQDLTDTVSGRLGNGDEQKALEAKTAANLEKYGYGNWYDYQIAKWGTKYP